MLTIAKIMWARALVLGSLTMQECSSLKPGEATGWDQLSQPLKSFNGDLYVEVTMGGNTGEKCTESGKREDYVCIYSFFSSLLSGIYQILYYTCILYVCLCVRVCVRPKSD